MSGAAPSREVAYRVFADEYAQATYSYAESDDDRAPQYLVTPTGARVNRIFVVGVLTETEEVSDGVLRARIVDPTGAFVLYAGQYQPDALAFFERTEPPAFVAVTGKARTFEPEGSDRVYTSLRPERANVVDAATRDRWNVETARQTLARSGLLAQALDAPERGTELRTRLREAGVEPGLAAGIPNAIREYQPTTAYLATIQEMALDAVRVVANEIEEVQTVAGAPDNEGTSEVRTEFADVTLAPTVGDESPAPEPSGANGETAADVEDGATEPEEGAEAVDVESEIPQEPSHGDDEEPPQPDADEFEDPEQTPSEPKTRSDEDEAANEEGDEFYELSEEERAEVEENYDVGFESGANIGTPEETPDIEPEAGTPDEADGAEDESPDEAAADDEPRTSPAESETEVTTEAEPAGAAEDDAEAETFTEGELQNLVVDTLQELGDGEGVAREELIDTLQDRHDLGESEIEDAIQAALLGGRCFESGADHLKPI